MNFDQILSAIGGFGRYQKTLYVWICLPQILLAFHMMVSIFTGSTPPNRCRDSSISVAGNQSSFPGTLSLNFSLLSESSCFSSDVLQQEDNRTERVPCGRGWVYSKETFQSTTVTEVQYRMHGVHIKYDLLLQGGKNDAILILPRFMLLHGNMQFFHCRN